MHLNSITSFDYNRFVEGLVILVAPCKRVFAVILDPLLGSITQQT